MAGASRTGISTNPSRDRPTGRSTTPLNAGQDSSAPVLAAAPGAGSRAVRDAGRRSAGSLVEAEGADQERVQARGEEGPKRVVAAVDDGLALRAEGHVEHRRHPGQPVEALDQPPVERGAV